MVPLSQADWSRIPFHLRHSLKSYAEEGRIPGRFLTAVLADKLDMATSAADPQSWKALPDILDFMHRYLPPRSYGTPERVADWEGIGGLDGLAVQEHLMQGVGSKRGARYR